MKNIRIASLALCVLGVSLSALSASGRFPSANPDLRVGTPDDPGFDCAEADDEDGQTCAGDLFAQQVNLFGFAPSFGQGVGIPPAPPANVAVYAEGPKSGQPQISGVSADAAWKVGIGRFDTIVAVTDTGIRWNSTSIRAKVWLNRGELPRPQDAAGTVLQNPSDVLFDGYDVNNDGRFNVDDYAGDPRVNVNGGPNGVGGQLDGQDLLRAFSDGTDADANGYIDDIAGWDFFEDDNDAYDASSYSAASGHGTGRLAEAGEEGDDGQGDIGVCPQCSLMPLRIWDTFVTPGDTWASATVYAADMGVSATVAAIGMLQNSESARTANAYAASKGVALMQVSSDLNTANHNYPTNYNESIYINGCVADVHGLSSEFFDFGGSGSFGAPVSTWFRSSGLTQYGAKATVCFVGVTGSQDTGQAGGAAGLLHAEGRKRAADIGGRLSSNEIKQLLTMTAEDVLPGNTLGTGTPDPSQVGFDEHFGYGRAHLGDAIKRIAPGRVPPEAIMQSPAWWAIIDPGATATGRTVTIRGLAQARRSTACTYRVEYGLGIEPAANSYVSFGTGTCPSGATVTGAEQDLATLPLDTVAALIQGSRNGTFNQTGQRPDPNQHTLTVRLVVTDAAGNRAEDRKVYFVHHDPTWKAGWPKFVDVAGETSPLLFDIDGNGTLEILDATSGGALCLYQHDGTLLPSFNGGACWQLSPAFWYHPDAPGFKSGAVVPPSGGLRTPAVADLDGDFEPDIVVPAADGRLFVLRPDGSTRLTLGVDPANSAPGKRNERDHPKRGLLGTVTLADLDRDGTKEIILPALDGFLYVWNGKTGAARPGFPVEVKQTPVPAGLAARGELIQTVSVADLDGDGTLEIVTGSADVIPGAPRPPSGPPPLTGGSGALVDYVLANSAGGDTRIYAYKADGTPAAGWPKALTGILPDVLPFVGPQHGTAAADFDADGRDDIVASMTTGNVTLFRGNGTVAAFGSQGVVNGGATSESSKILNLFENSIVGNLNGTGQLDVAHLGVTTGQVANLLLVGQNAPFNWAVQAWDGQTPENFIPGYPTATDDYGLLSSPGIANVDGGGTNELLVGTGLYLLHAYNAQGLEATGFPKLTGGWQFAVPAVGDVDGDGMLNLVMSTREGYRFVWNLNSPATTANNSEWWTEGHDECHSNNYRIDCRPPNRVRNLAYSGGMVSFVAPGDDWAAGRPQRYEVRTLTRPILTAEDWAAATPLADVTATVDSGATQSFAFAEPATGLFLAVVPVDDAGNRARFVQVKVGNFPPVAVLDATPNPQSRGRTLTLSGTGSSDTEGDAITEYRFTVRNSGGAVVASQTTAAATFTLTLAPSGAYTTSLVVVAGGKTSTTVTTAIQITNTAPVATLSATPDSGRSPLTVTLNASGADPDPGDSIAALYRFNCGDGTADVEVAVPTYQCQYNADGSYPASVVVFDSENLASAPAVQQVVVLGDVPVAALQISPNPQRKGQPITLDGSASVDPQGDAITEYRFRVRAADGSVLLDRVQASSTVSDLRLNPSGSYTATLQVVDSTGEESAVATRTITVTNTVPVASLVITPTVAAVQTNIAMDASASSDADSDAGDAVRLWRFDFGDGSPLVDSVAPAVSHRYPSAGAYTVRLLVFDAEGAASTVSTQTVQIYAVVAGRELQGVSSTAPGAKPEGRFGGGGMPATLTVVALALLAARGRRRV